MEESAKHGVQRAAELVRGYPVLALVLQGGGAMPSFSRSTCGARAASCLLTFCR
jgi:hypothetical protein